MKTEEFFKSEKELLFNLYNDIKKLDSTKILDDTSDDISIKYTEPIFGTIILPEKMKDQIIEFGEHSEEIGYKSLCYTLNFCGPCRLILKDLNDEEISISDELIENKIKEILEKLK
jgi:hypothetical protein